jgi:hypothetical protein
LLPWKIIESLPPPLFFDELGVIEEEDGTCQRIPNGICKELKPCMRFLKTSIIESDDQKLMAITKVTIA